MQQKTHAFGAKYHEISRVLYEHEIRKLNEMVRKNELQKIVQERKFPELTAEKAKLIIKQLVLKILLS